MKRPDNAPLVSVIVPMYKTPFLLLRRCLDSILKQSLKEFELLVVDDGSGSEYDGIRQEYEAKDPRVRFLVKENGGVASARNYGIDHSRGEYISFIDSDDYIEGYFLEGLLQTIQGCEMALCAVTEMEFSVKEFMYNEKMFFSLPSCFTGLQYINFSVNKLYRADIIKEHHIRFPLDVKMGEDALFLAEYYPHCRLIRCNEERWYHYCLNLESAMRVYKPQYWEWETEVIRADWELFHRYPLAEREEMAMLHWVYEKMMGAANYYFDYEEDETILGQYYQAILNNEIIRKLFEADLTNEEMHFSEQEKKIISIIRKQGVRGLRKFVHKRIGE